MSAYVVDDSTINGPVTFLAECAWTKNLLSPLGYNLTVEEDRKRLAEDMFQLNCDAVNQRYGPGEAASFRDLDFVYQPHVVDAVQALKSLRSWHYQCCEGDIPETSALFQAMEAIIETPLFKSIARSPAYERAIW